MPKNKSLNPIVPDEKIIKALTKNIIDNKISCASMLKLADNLRISSLDVGKAIDFLNAKICQCQLGLFGHSPEKKIVTPDTNISDNLKKEIIEASIDNTIECKSCFKIANTLALKKLNVSCACEGLKIKIKNCQIGAF
ncbi:MAG: hypothetical protein HQK76_02820 [Desulfobacterales bacterium]|nr:hypothetical protein [Desulfobacterales bacterium]